jgi:hypothetical protein
MTDVIEKAAEAHYAEYFAGVQDLEPKWTDLPDDARARFIEAMQAAYTAIVGDKVLVDRDSLEQVRIALQNCSEIKSRYEHGENEQDRAVSAIAAMLNASEGG